MKFHGQLLEKDLRPFFFIFVLRHAINVHHACTWTYPYFTRDCRKMEELVAAPECQGSKCEGGEEAFSDVKRKRKRGKEPEMDTSESPAAGAKRPVFPPVNISTSLVGT